MISGGQYENLLKSILDGIPEDLEKGRENLQKNLRAALNAGLVRMNLVTREEFDIQSELLSRTRALADELERKVRRLEERGD